MDLMKRFILKSRIHRGACLLYVASVISLLTIHFWFAVTEHLSCFQLFVDFVLPFLILSPLYGLVWRKNLLAKLLLYHLPSVKLYALLIPAASTGLIIFFRNAPFAYFITPLLSVFAITTAPYVLISKAKSAVLIAIESVWFILLTATLGDSISFIVIFISALILIHRLEKLNWYYSGGERHVFLATILSVLFLGIFAHVIISIDNSPIINALVTSYFSSIEEVRDPNLFSKAGWVVLIPLVTLNLSAIYLLHSGCGIQYFLGLASLCIILIYSLGYMLNCLGSLFLPFYDLVPFISGGFAQNITYLCMSAVILPPKQKRLLDIDIEDVVED